VARVAVDDETGAAFKDLCGPMPASVRLGQLVVADVERSRQPAAEPDAIAAIEAIRGHLIGLEALARNTERP
jgi:hypothetical protein